MVINRRAMHLVAQAGVYVLHSAVKLNGQIHEVHAKIDKRAATTLRGVEHPV